MICNELGPTAKQKLQRNNEKFERTANTDLVIEKNFVKTHCKHWASSIDECFPERKTTIKIEKIFY